MPLSEGLRETMRQWTSGVCIVSSKFMDTTHGMTVNSLTSVSLDPPLIIITLMNKSRTSQIIQEAGLFSVSILKDTQKSLADKFSGKLLEEGSRFQDVETIVLPNGTPAIQGSLATMECKVFEKYPLRESTMFLAEVLYTQIDRQGNPLVYHNREYHIL